LLGSRIAELICLCLPQGDSWLQWGALPTGGNRGLAWVEMARGLLVHQVSLDRQSDGSARVLTCQVLAPTEWNFHPEGIAAQALAGLSAHRDDTDAKARLLMAALDPCVPFRLDSATQIQAEPHHA
jgi:coenzyme F420-reducing hydrogenase alpha subunit